MTCMIKYGISHTAGLIRVIIRSYVYLLNVDRYSHVCVGRKLSNISCDLLWSARKAITNNRSLNQIQ